MFKKGIGILLSVFAFAGYAGIFVAGKDYMVLPASSQVQPAKTARVVEYFNYGCPACFHLEPMIEQWITAHPNQSFTRIPVVFHPEWLVYAKAYYAAEALALLPKANTLFFTAIQTDRVVLNTDSDMISFFIEKLGVDKPMAESIFLHSTAIEMQVKAGMMQASQDGINQIPAFIVNQRYKTDLGLAKDPKRLIELLNFLLTLPTTA